MPDKTHGMVIHEQICINLLVTVLAKGAALGKVGMLIEIFQNSRIVGTAGGFFRQQARISSSLSGGKSEMGTEKAEGVASLSLGVLVLQAVNLLHRQFLGLALQGVHH